MIFVDTSFWAALRMARDRHHRSAVSLLRTVAPGHRLMTTNLVVGETWTLVNRRTGHATAVGFLDAVHAAGVQIVRVSQAHEDDALRFLRTRAEREYSYVDATSFVVMRDLRITDALAFDGDFTAAGFVELRPV